MEKPGSYEALSTGDDPSGRSRWPKGLSRALTCRHVVATVERETRACGCMGYLMPKIFPSMGRSGRVDSKGGVVGRKQNH